MARRLDDWLRAYLDYTHNTEPPLQFHVWSAISVLAGVLQRRCYVEWEGTIYPNQYIILVGNSGTTRKGVAIGRAKWFLRQLRSHNVRLIAGNRVTKEQLVNDIADHRLEYSDRDGQQLVQSAVTHIVPELSVFLGHQDILLLGWLTDWWDSDDEWEYRTKTAGTVAIEFLCYNLLGASSPDWFSSMLPKEAIGGGFTSRCIFVYQRFKRKVVAMPRMTPREHQLREDLLWDLMDMMDMTGEFVVTQDGMDAYIEWYEQQEDDILNGLPPIRDRRFEHYIGRRQTHLWKLAMVMSTARSNEMLITGRDIERAKGLLVTVEKGMPDAFGGLGTGQYSQLIYTVLSYLAERGQATQSELLRQHRHSLDHYSLNIVIENLKAMHLIEQVLTMENALDPLYRHVAPNEQN